MNLEDLKLVNGNITMTAVWLTPDFARRLLERMPHNRPLRRGRVSLMADDIRNGRYIFNPNPIVIDDDGQLIDGQHRCHGVIEADRPIPVIVMTGFPHETMDVIDTGRARTVGDILQLEDIQIAQRNIAAAGVKAVIQHARFPNVVWSGPGSYVSQQEVLLALKSDPAHWSDLAQRAHSISAAPGVPPRRIGGWITGASMTAALHIISESSSSLDLLPDFEKGLRTGEMLRPGDPRLILRSATNHQQWGGHQSSLLAIIVAWNKYVQEQPMKIIRARQSMLPIPSPI